MTMRIGPSGIRFVEDYAEQGLITPSLSQSGTATYPILVESKAELNALLPIVITSHGEENIYFRRKDENVSLATPAQEYYAKEGSQAWDILDNFPDGIVPEPAPRTRTGRGPTDEEAQSLAEAGYEARSGSL